ncbi:unnamed protein product [Durusdinium trenchii]|uniref:Uncharacterized protein n=1 Tax=Durusdinium trenchii TaxID=1381693 RepID=A0ABP0JE44_9DINO
MEPGAGCPESRDSSFGGLQGLPEYTRQAVPAEHLEDGMGTVITKWAGWVIVCQDNVSEIANLVSMDVVEDLEEELVDSVPDDRIKRLAALVRLPGWNSVPPDVFDEKG